MNEQTQKLQASKGRGALSSVASRCVGVGSVQESDRAANQVAHRHCHATDRWQCQQWPLVGVVALSVRGSWLDEQEHHQACIDGTGRARVDLLHPQGAIAERGRLVRDYVGTTES